MSLPSEQIISLTTILRHNTEASISEKEAFLVAELSSWKGEVCKIWSDFFDFATVEEK